MAAEDLHGACAGATLAPASQAIRSVADTVITREPADAKPDAVPDPTPARTPVRRGAFGSNAG